MSTWDVVNARAKPLAEELDGPYAPICASGKSFWHLVGLLQGLNDELPDEPVIHTLGLVLLDALDYYEGQNEQ